MAEDKLGALVKKLWSFNFRCSGSSSFNLASSMSLLMAVIRASFRDEEMQRQVSEDGIVGETQAMNNDGIRGTVYTFH